MNINNFKEYINPTILDRGYDYYNNGNIIDVDEQRHNEYVFGIEGSEDYQVIVEINDDGEIVNSYCDCPYDFGPICKHEVATYFKLLEIFNNKNGDETIKRKVKKKQNFNELLNSISKEDLIEIIINATKKDKTLKDNIIFRYSKNDDEAELKNCKKLIKSIVREYSDRGGFIPYMQTYAFVSEFEELLEKIRYTKNKLLALDIATLVLEEAMEAFQYADDSNGEIGSLVDETIALINEIAENSINSDVKLREKMFNRILKLSENEIFNGWVDFKIEILDICLKFSDVEAFRNKLINKISGCIDKNSEDDYCNRYKNENMLKILFEIIEEYGTEEEAEEFIKNNLQYTYFKEILINSYFDKKNYNKVIELCLKAEDDDEQYSGLVFKWKEIRYNAYKKLSLKEEQMNLGKNLLFHREFKYYKELKELADDKEIFYKEMKKELKRNCMSMYIKLIEEEKDLDAIMDLVREIPGYIETYAEILGYKFKDEITDIYGEFVRKQASYASDRKAYQRVCGIIKKYKKIAGKENTGKIINEFKVLYVRRRAFIDELSKI